MAGGRLILLIQIAKGLATQFGENCEVVVHDLARNQLEHSIVHIENGHVSNRKVGGSPSGAVFDALKHHDGPLPDHLAYLTKTDNGHILKSSTIYVHDDNDEPCYVLSINYDITNLLALEGVLSSLTSCPTTSENEIPQSPKRITLDVNDILDELIDQSIALVGVPVTLMTKDDKIKAINYLNDAGAFLITKSGDKVAKFFNISKYTLYSYVEINK
ncbi:MAG: helix-turn-helix transcriptional regulator [Hespellia sp.]|nr:helix-turn-helix transcriptional regulator [Hespellia sp.]